MHALERPQPARAESILGGTPVALLLTLFAAWAATCALVAMGWLPRRAGGVVGLAAAHGALLGVALAWTARHARARAWIPAALLAIAGTLAELAATGLVAYALVPLWIIGIGRARGIAWLRPVSPALILTAAVVGALLGAHMLIGATLTLGHRIGLPDGMFLRWLAYDVGANVPAAEAFFRGALFARVHRRWSLGAATAISTGAYVARYLLDPLLPRTLELVAGAAFYLSLLGIANCWFFARTGSILPGLAASLLFFAAYRLLAPA